MCFIGQLDMKEFLLTYIKPKKERFYYRKDPAFAKSFGGQVGTHDGVYYYTIGQRHGLDIKDGAGPYYVVAKDIKKNIIYVGPDVQVVANKTKIREFNWLNKPNPPVRLDVKVRYRTKSVKARIDTRGTPCIRKSERAVTSGQSAVFYRGQELIGGESSTKLKDWCRSFPRARVFLIIPKSSARHRPEDRWLGLVI